MTCAGLQGLGSIDLVLAARTDPELNLSQGLALEALFLELATIGRVPWNSGTPTIQPGRIEQGRRW